MTGFKKSFPILRNGENFFTRTRARRILSRLLITVLSLALLVVIAGSILTFIAKKKAEEEFKKANGTFSSLRVDLFTRSVTVKNISWASPNDSSYNQASIRLVKLKGISLFQLLANRRLHASELQVDSGSVSIDPSEKKDSLDNSPKKSLQFQIDNIIIRNVLFQLKKDSINEVEGLVNLNFGAIKMDSTTTLQASCQSVFNHFIGDITSLKVAKQNGLYSSKINKIEFNSDSKSINIDSLKLIPKYGKYEFAKVHGKQVSRLELSIPSIEIEGFDFSKLFDSLILINKVSVHSANLHSFRDKRVTFNHGVVELPMKSLREIAFALEIDSIAIDSSRITIEEFAEQATQPGRINFQNLTALMTRLSNRYYTNKPKYAQLDASAKLMGNGLVTASFRFPLDGSPLYSAKGKVSNLALTELNPMLENSAQVRIESGKLNELFFNFNYTDFKSNGTIEINYEDLKLTKINADKEKSIDLLQTVLINAFLKKTKDESTEQSKRIGVIDIERDRQRFVFNFWWKSIQSGLKSSVLGN